MKNVSKAFSKITISFLQDITNRNLFLDYNQPMSFEDAGV